MPKDGRGGREINCPPRKKGAGRSAHKQATQDRNHLRYPSPWFPHSLANPHPTRPRHAGCTSRPGGRPNTIAQRSPAYHPAEGPQSRRENHRCVYLAYPGALRPNGCLTPASPSLLGTRRPQCAARPQPGHPKHPTIRHKHTHKAPTKSCQTQSMPLRRACRRTKATRLICWSKHTAHQRSPPQNTPRQADNNGLQTRHRHMGLTCSLRGRLTTKAQRGPAHHPTEKPQSRRVYHRCVCLVVPGASRSDGRLTPASPQNHCIKRRPTLASSQPNHPKRVRTRHTRTHNVPAELRQAQST